MFTDIGREMVVEMDQKFIQENISPGGSADLLAVTIMLNFMGKGCGETY